MGKLADGDHEFHFLCGNGKRMFLLKSPCGDRAMVTDNRGYFVCDCRHAYSIR